MVPASGVPHAVELRACRLGIMSIPLYSSHPWLRIRVRNRVWHRLGNCARPAIHKARHRPRNSGGADSEAGWRSARIQGAPQGKYRLAGDSRARCERPGGREAVQALPPVGPRAQNMILVLGSDCCHCSVQVRTLQGALHAVERRCNEPPFLPGFIDRLRVIMPLYYTLNFGSGRPSSFRSSPYPLPPPSPPQPRHVTAIAWWHSWPYPPPGIAYAAQKIQKGEWFKGLNCEVTGSVAMPCRACVSKPIRGARTPWI